MNHARDSESLELMHREPEMRYADADVLLNELTSEFHRLHAQALRDEVDVAEGGG